MGILDLIHRQVIRKENGFLVPKSLSWITNTKSGMKVFLNNIGVDHVIESFHPK